MQTVSEAWKQEQRKKLIAAESFVELSLLVGDPEAQNDTSATDNGHEAMSDLENVFSEEKKDYVRYATLERNFWILNKTRKILPNSAPYGENGFVGNTLSDENCEFTVIPTITILFSKVYQTLIPGITITWAKEYEGEYADTYSVSAYNGTTQVFTETVTNNSDVTSVLDADIQNYNKITIEVLKWSKPSRRARIDRIVVGIEKIYTKQDIINSTHSMLVDPLSAQLPEAQITFEIKNLNGEYNPDNPQSTNKYLMERQSVTARYGYRFGDTIEWIRGGTFFLSEWNCPQNGITATFTARDALEYMGDTYTGPSSGTLLQIATAALNQANLPKMPDGSNRWYLDASLGTIQAAADADLSENTIAEVLQYVANAGCCVFYQDRQGLLRIEPLNTLQTDYRIDMFNSYANSEINLLKPLKAVDINNGQYVLTVGTSGETQSVSNPLITDARAPIVAQWVANYLTNRQNLSGNFRADPRLDALDRIKNENQFSEKTVLITQIEYTYNGAFRGSYEGVAGA